MQLEGSHRQVEGSLGSSWLELAPGTGTLSSDSNSFLLPLSWILTRECLRTVEGGAGKAENSPGAAAFVAPGRSRTR